MPRRKRAASQQSGPGAGSAGIPAPDGADQQPVAGAAQPVGDACLQDPGFGMGFGAPGADSAVTAELGGAFSLWQCLEQTGQACCASELAQAQLSCSQLQYHLQRAFHADQEALISVQQLLIGVALEDITQGLLAA